MTEITLPGVRRRARLKCVPTLSEGGPFLLETLRGQADIGVPRALVAGGTGVKVGELIHVA
jgi:hypothetical protein